MTPYQDRPKECRDTCGEKDCIHSGCRMLRDEAKDPLGTVIVVVEYEKKEGRHERNRT